MHLDALRALTRTQHGLATRHQLVRQGVPASTIDSWVERGEIVVSHRGVYQLAGSPTTWEQRLLAVTMATGGIASHRSAARLWGILDDDTFEVIVGPGRSARVPGTVVHRLSHHIRPSTRLGRPVTSPLDTVALLGAVVDRDTAEAALHDALIARLLTITAARRGLARRAHPGVRGPAVLRAVLDEWDLGLRPPDSKLETRFPKLLRQYSLPPAEFQHWVELGRGKRARIDFAYPASKIALEIEGRERHDLPLDRERDAKRRNRLTGLGWIVLVFTWLRVVRDSAGVAADIRAALTSRETQLVR